MPGEEEDAEAVVWGAEVRGRRVARRGPLEAQCSKLSPNRLGVVKKAGDVLDEDGGGLALEGDSDEVGPQGSLVVVAGAGAGGGVGLAGQAGSEEIHLAAIRSAVEGREIVPDRSRIQGRVLHPRHEVGRCTGFPLNVTHGAYVASECEVDSEVEHADPGAEVEGMEGT